MAVAQTLDELEHRLGALLHGQGRPLAAHVGLHPAGVETNRQDAVVLEVQAQRARHRVQRRLAGAVRVEAALVVLRDGAEHGAHVDDHGPAAALGRRLVALGGRLERREQGLGEHQRRDGVGEEVLRHLLHLHQVHPGELGGDARAVEQHVEAVILDDRLHLLGEVVVAAEVLDVYLQHVHVLVLGGNGAKFLGLLRVPASRDQVFGGCRPLDELLHEAQAQPAVAAGDQDGLHSVRLRGSGSGSGSGDDTLRKITSLALGGPLYVAAAAAPAPPPPLPLPPRPPLGIFCSDRGSWQFGEICDCGDVQYGVPRDQTVRGGSGEPLAGR